MEYIKHDSDMHSLDELLASYEADITVSWGAHPIALPRRFGIITAKEISKGQAARELTESEGLKSEELLGIGDSTSDWQFIGRCGYAGAMGNASDELKKLVASRGDHSFIGGSVDDNGILDIFNHFGL